MRPNTITAFALGVVTGAVITGATIFIAPDASASPVQEDDPSWSCVLDGNHVCGPNNAMGAVPGRYENGLLAQPWPTATLCTRPVTVADLMLGGAPCTTEYVNPALVVVTGALR